MSDRQNQDLPPLEIVESDETPAGSGGGVPDPASLGLQLPEEPQEAIDLLLEELRDARNEADSYLSDLKRVAADFENYRKRSLREQQQTVERASERVVRELLPVLDSFEAALAIEPQTESEEKLLAGVRSTYNQLLDALRREGLEIIPSWGEPFDPEVHEAVVSTGGGQGRLVVSQEMRKGYTVKGRVLRAALVAVEPEDGSPEDEGAGSGE